MGNYADAADNPAAGLDITRTRAIGRTKYGVASSSDLELAAHLGGFLRLSWNDGHNETWAFTEIDASEAAGLNWKPVCLGRPDDEAGLAVAVNELSGAHRRYLAAGGLGFIIGDGALLYGPEVITEAYYRFKASATLWISPDAQFIVTPAYNRARGPVPVWGLRVHSEF